MKFDLQKFLKNLKLNESEISMFLGALVVIVTGILVVNYFKDKNPESLPDLSTQTSVKEHIVAKGETLWSISEDAFGSGYNWVDIYKENDLKSESLEVGQKLVIPQAPAKEPTSTKETQVVAKTENKISGDSYTVVKGDSLWKIAVRTYGDGYKWVEIAKANKLGNPNIIHAGNVLTLPR